MLVRWQDQVEELQAELDALQEAAEAMEDSSVHDQLMLVIGRLEEVIGLQSSLSE